MKNKIKLLVLIFSFSCDPSNVVENGEVETIPFQIKDMVDVNLSDVVDVNKIIQLEINEEALIGKIDKLIQNGDRIYILDRQIAKSVFCFKNTGEFLFKINNFLDNEDFPDMDFAFKDFIIDKESGMLEIFDAKNSQILIFNLEGLYQSKIDVPFSVIQFEKTSGNYLFFRGNSYSKDSVFDFEMIYLENDFYPIRNLRNQRREIPEAGESMVSLYPPKVFSKFAQKVRYNDYFTDTIFTIKGGEIANAIYLDMGSQSPQSTWKTKTNDEIFNHFINRDLRGYIMSKYIVFEDTEKIWFSVTYEYEGCLALYDKTTENTTFYRVLDDGKLGLDGYSILTNGTPYQGVNSLLCVVYAQDRKDEKANFKEEINPSLLILDLAKLPLN